jgi:hypothetical protein
VEIRTRASASVPARGSIIVRGAHALFRYAAPPPTYGGAIIAERDQEGASTP